jgi:hypothetical protein
MMPTTVSTIGIRMPNDFPVYEYEEMHKLVITRNSNTEIDSVVLSQFQGGWNAVAHRFRATADHDQAFTIAINESADSRISTDTALAFENKHVQERELFGFFVTGLSVLESIAYSVFALCSMVNAQAFPMQTAQDRRRVGLAETEKRLLANFPGEQLTNDFRYCLDDTEFQQWKDIRNTLAHRTSPPRLYRQTVSVGTPDTSITSWAAEWPDFGLSLDTNTTADRRIWLANRTSEFLKAANKFGRQHL